MSRTAAIVGGAAGPMALVGIVVILFFLCQFYRRTVSRTSEMGSSDPSNNVERNVGVESSFREARRFSIEELSLASKNFSDQSLIGQGKFGEVFMGLLDDGMLVAIKRRHGGPTQEFIEEACYLSSIQHRNLVTLLGYCQENGLQFLVYEYVPNGSVSSHLHGAGQVSREKLEFKHRLSIALGAAKGLAHIHSLSPRLLHNNFKTANVLVDENLTAQVADAGIRNFLRRDVAGPSAQVNADAIFQAPEVRELQGFSERSDAYSFGVFLVELVSGREAVDIPPSSDSDRNLVDWVPSGGEMGSMVDASGLRRDSVEGLMGVMRRCLEISSERRPGMVEVVTVLERILDKETVIMGEGMPTVTPGSQLFEAPK